MGNDAMANDASRVMTPGAQHNRCGTQHPVYARLKAPQGSAKKVGSGRGWRQGEMDMKRSGNSEAKKKRRAEARR